MKIEVELTGFTPVLDNLIQEYDLVTASIYGIVWRYAQMSDKVCKASLEKIGKRLDLSGKTAERHIKKLCTGGYLVDLTPDVRNKPHSYAVTGKAELTSSIVARSDSVSDQGKTESLTWSDTESDQGKTESPLKKDTKIHTKKDKASSANADYSRPVSLLSEKEIKALKLTAADWQQYLTDEQVERQRKGVIDFVEKKLAKRLLLPDTPASLLLFRKIAIEYDAKGRRPPENFPTLAIKEKFDSAAIRLNGTLGKAIQTGIENVGVAIPKLVNYVASPKWQENTNGLQEKGSTQSGQPKTYGNQGSSQQTNFAPAAGSGQSAETAAKLRAAFAPKL